MGIGFQEVPASDVPPVPEKLFTNATLGALTCSASATATGSTTQVGYPRIAAFAIGNDQTYAPPYAPQVTGNVISSLGYFSTATYSSTQPAAWLGRFDVVVISGRWETWGSSSQDRALLVDAIKQIMNVGSFLHSKVLQYHLLEGQNITNPDYPTLSTTISNEKWWLYTSANESGSIALSTFSSSQYETNWAIAWPGAVGRVSADQSFSTHRTTAQYDGLPEDLTQYAAAYFSELTFARHSSVSTVVDGTIPASSYSDTRFSSLWVAQEKAPNLDGIFLDNMWSSPRSTGYYDLLNSYSAAWNSVVGPWLVRGYEHLHDRFVKIMALCFPSRTYFRTGNIGDWVKVYGNSVSVFNSMNNGLIGELDGGLLEQMFGPNSWSPEHSYSFDTIITAYNAISDFCNQPLLVILHSLLASATDYQGARFGLSAACMGNGCGSLTTSQNYGSDNYPFFDEFGGNPGTNVGRYWLGQPLGVRPSAPAINGAWVRDFQHGTVICNPYGNGAQTITPAQLNNYLGTNYTFRFFVGVQVPSLNSGQTMGSVTLQARDGVFLKH